MTMLRRCTSCILPETHETIVFDEHGVCNLRKHDEHKKINWSQRRKAVDGSFASYRGKHNKDCLVPFSCGKE